MTSHWLFQLAVLAVLVFWMLGAYNRLMRLRNAVAAAWEQVLTPLQRRSEAMAAAVEALREPFADEAGTLQALLDADVRQRQAADAVKSGRCRVGPVAAWVAAEAGLASPGSRLRALIDLQQPVLAEVPTAAALQAALASWIELEPRLAFTRQAFNEAAEQYNRALHQWPTRLLTPMFGHRDAGRV